VPYVTKYFKVRGSYRRQNLILTGGAAFGARVAAARKANDYMGFCRNLAGVRAAMRRQPARAVSGWRLRRSAPYVTKCFKVGVSYLR
jgi:hypothetical protein